MYRRSGRFLCLPLSLQVENLLNSSLLLLRQYLFHGATALSGPRPSHYRRFTITFRHTHTTLGRNPLDQWSARRRDLYLTTQNTHKTETSMPPPGFEPAIPSSERPQTHALDRAATGIAKRQQKLLIIRYSCLAGRLSWHIKMGQLGCNTHSMPIRQT
jgi:hypothetical protein